MKEFSVFFVAVLMAGAPPLTACPPSEEEAAHMSSPSPCCNLKWGASHFDVLSQYRHANAGITMAWFDQNYLKWQKVDGRLWNEVKFYFNKGKLYQIRLIGDDSYDVYKENLRSKYGDPIEEVDGTGGPRYDVLEYDYTRWIHEETDSLITITRTYESDEDIGFILEYKRFSECEDCQRLLEEAR